MTDLGTIRGQIRLDVRQAVAAYAAVRAQNQRTVYALRGTGDSFVQAGKTMAIAGAGMIWVFSKVVRAAADFERKMDFYGAVSDTSAKGLAKVSEFTLQLAQDTIYSANQIADGVIELGKAGVSAEEIIGGFGTAMANLGAAGDIDLGKSGQIITSTMQQFKLATEDAVHVTDLLAGAANASIADIDDIGVSLKYVGGVANAAGLKFEDTVTAISLLAKAGIRGSTAGTSLRQMLVSLGGATKPARESLERLGIMTEDGGNKFFTAEGKAKSLSKIFQILQDSTKDLTQKERLMELRTIFNNRALAAASILTRDGAKGFKNMNKEMSKVTAAEVAAERLDNLSGDIEILQGNIETLATKAGGPFQETLRGWVQDITKLIQVFANLEPETQKMILETIAITGAALVAMGTISIFIGVIARFIAACLKMAAGMKFVWKILRIVMINLKWLRVLLLGPIIAALGAVTLPVWLLIGAIAALIAGLVIAYKKFEPFRKAVHSIIDGLVAAAIAVWNFLKLLVKDPGAAWEKTKKAFWDLVDTAKDAISRIPGLLRKWLKQAVSAVVAFGGKARDAFRKLVGKILRVVGGFIGDLVGLFTLENIGFAIGFMVGTAIRLFVLMGVKVLSAIVSMLAGILKLFASLPGKLGFALGFLIGKVVGAFIQMGAKVGIAVAKMVMNTYKWFRSLPGRVVGFIGKMAARVMSRMIRFKNEFPGMAARAITGMIEWFRGMPDRVLAFFVKMAIAIPKKLKNMKDKMVSFATRMINGFVRGFNDLPEKTGQILDNMIQLIKDTAKAAFEAVKDFAAGMWEGFKAGLGINSPSYMEKAMWQISGVLDTETKKIAKKTMQVQKLSKKMAETQFGVGGGAFDIPGRSGYVGLASMHERNQNRARTLQDSAGKRRDGARQVVNKKTVTNDIDVINPKPERAGQSVSKVLKTKVEEAGWR